MGKRWSLQNIMLGKLDSHNLQKNEIKPYLTPLRKNKQTNKKKPQNGINLKWNIRPKTVKLLKENIEGKL